MIGRIAFLRNRLPVILIIILFIILAAVPSVYFYSEYQKLKQAVANPSATSREEIKALVEKIGKFYDLPQGEEPVVATVSDVEKVKNQPFFAKAKLGDKVLVYNNAKKAILYDPLANKILEVGPVNISTTSSTPVPPMSTTSTPATESLKFVLYNGTPKTGLTLKYEETLKKTIANAQITDRDNAKKNDYPKTILIDINGTKEKEAQQISGQLAVTVGALPEGETKPGEGDFLIILGADKIN